MRTEVAGAATRPRRRGERGLTLVEMIVTIAVMTVAVIGITASLAQTEKVAGITQDQSQLEVAMRHLSDYVRDSSSAGLAYVQCGNYAPSALPSPPAGVTFAMGAVVLGSTEYRNAASASPVPVSPPPGGNCGAKGNDFGVQEITLSVSSASRTLTRTVWKSASW